MMDIIRPSLQPNYHTEFLTFLNSSAPFFCRVLPTSKLLLRARFRCASVVARLPLPSGKLRRQNWAKEQQQHKS